MTDFNGAEDFLSFRAASFTGGLMAGQALTAAQLVAGADPVSSGNGGQFLYDTGSGNLTWDANGATAGGETLIATFTSHPTLALDDFQIF